MQHSKPYSIGFILIITALFGLLLALAASALRERQQFNEEVNVKRNILMAVGVLDRDREMELDEIDAMYQESVQSFAVDPEGTIVEGVSGESLDLEVELQNPDTSQHRYPVFMATDAGGSTVYAIPVFGKGLWSTLYGYLALEADLETVRGMTFYAHGEPPALAPRSSRRGSRTTSSARRSTTRVRCARFRSSREPWRTGYRIPASAITLWTASAGRPSPAAGSATCLKRRWPCTNLSSDGFVPEDEELDMRGGSHG